MYVNLRRYPRIGASKAAIEQSVEHELLPELRKHPGFKGYFAFWDEQDAGVSVSLFEDQEAAHRSTDTARLWVMRHQDFFPERGEEVSGESIAQEKPPGPQQSFYVLIRELDNVPGTQDTQAFVQQRTLPMITRSPGFRGVYMVRNDREAGRAAVVTLFDTRQNAEACHGRAKELLREGLPNVTISRVVQGQGVILRIGET